MYSYRLKKAASLAKGRILDVGFAAFPNPYLHGNVYGLDLVSAPKPPNYAGVITWDAMKLMNLDQKFDSVIAGEVIEHLDNPIQFLVGVYQVLNPGGSIILTTPNPYHPPMVLLECLMIRKYYYDEGHVNIFLPRFLVRLMERIGFVNVRTTSGGTWPPFFKFDIPSPRFIAEDIFYLGNKPA